MIILGIVTLYLTNRILEERTDNQSRFLSLVFLSLLLGSTLLEGNSVNSEVVFIAFNLGAFFLLLTKRNYWLVGFLGFLSFVTKVPGFVEFCLFLFVFLILYLREDGVRKLIPIVSKIAAGFLLPHVVLLVYFYLNSALTDYVYSNFVFNAIYSLHEGNFTTLFGLEIPNTLLKMFSLVFVFVVGLYLNIRGKLSRFSFLVSVLFTSQLFASLLSGKNYGHYFIQVLPGLTLALGLMLKKQKEGMGFYQTRYVLGLLVLLMPMLFVLKSVGRIPVYASPLSYYPAFVKEYVLDDSSADFWWRDGEGVGKTKRLTSHLNTNYPDYEGVYIYTDKPWVIALTDREIANKYVTWFHLDYREQHYDDEEKNILSTDLLVVDRDVKLIESVSQTLRDHFERIGVFDSFDVYRRI